MPDKFNSMTALLESIPCAGNYDFDIYDKNQSTIRLFAPHAGCIEPGTRRIAKNLAGDRWDHFIFIGKMENDCQKTLHVTSENYDEPRCVKMAKEATLAMAIHGCDRTDSCIEVGGGSHLVPDISAHLVEAGYRVLTPPAPRSGISARNFVNLAAKGGIQLELSVGFRKELYVDSKCLKPRQGVFDKFIADLRSWLLTTEKSLVVIVKQV